MVAKKVEERKKILRQRLVITMILKEKKAIDG